MPRRNQRTAGHVRRIQNIPIRRVSIRVPPQQRQQCLEIQGNFRILDNFQRILNPTTGFWSTVPNYYGMSDNLLIHKFCEALPNKCAELKQYLINPQFFSYAQSYAQLQCWMVILNYTVEYYRNIVQKLLPGINWLSHMPVTLPKQYLMHWEYPSSARDIQKKLELDEFTRKKVFETFLIILRKYFFGFSDRTAMSASGMADVVRHTVTMLLKTDLVKPTSIMKVKNIRLDYHINEVRLLKSFFDMDPNEQQKLIFQKLWHPAKQQSVHTNMTEHEIPSLNADNIDQYDKAYLNELLPESIHNILNEHYTNLENYGKQLASIRDSLHPS